jgi:hypothetical protein
MIAVYLLISVLLILSAAGAFALIRMSIDASRLRAEEGLARRQAREYQGSIQAINIARAWDKIGEPLPQQLESPVEDPVVIHGNGGSTQMTRSEYEQYLQRTRPRNY